MENTLAQSVYTLDEYGISQEVTVVFGTYIRGFTLSVSLYTRPSGSDSFTELYDVITVNFPESENLAHDTQFVDVNNHPHIEEWLVNNHIAEPTGQCLRSGYCRYPAYRFFILSRILNT